ncbi:MAG: hypothetical protein ABUL61_04605, partial [Oleiharenicola lentus]
RNPEHQGRALKPVRAAKPPTPSVQMPKNPQIQKTNPNFEPAGFGIVWRLGFGVWDLATTGGCR